ncbi:MAG TPA: hypothetical protein EYO35_14685 [Flavobacteriaceae bacterium]|nr:hypothetical protein [Flavobacteriaceae bacterium]
MRYFIKFSVSLTILVCFISCAEKKIHPYQAIVSSDIDNFFNAFDAIHQTTDSLEQLISLRTEFLDKASEGQLAMIAARNYSKQEYLDVILAYPKFWNSIRKNTNDMTPHNEALREGVQQLRNIYPDLESGTIYYTVGAFRSPGTGLNDKILIGSEFALGETTTDVSEFKGVRDHTANYYKIDPKQYLSFLTVHEYVHTQQKDIPDNLLSHTLREGIAEFVAIQAIGKDSPWGAFNYGPENETFVRNTFESQMFNGRSYGNWLWNGIDNLFGHHDMAYYVGYKIAQLHYDAATDKQKAIKELIELDFMDEQAVERLVDGSGYFSAKLDVLYENYQKNRPKVLAIEPFENGSQQVDPSIDEVTVRFTKPLDTLYRGFDFGPLGEQNAMKLTKYLGFSEDGKSVRFQVDLKPNTQYQLQLPSKFVDSDGNAIPPYLIDFKTSGN